MRHALHTSLSFLYSDYWPKDLLDLTAPPDSLGEQKERQKGDDDGNFFKKDQVVNQPITSSVRETKIPKKKKVQPQTHCTMLFGAFSISRIYLFQYLPDTSGLPSEIRLFADLGYDKDEFIRKEGDGSLACKRCKSKWAKDNKVTVRKILLSYGVQEITQHDFLCVF